MSTGIDNPRNIGVLVVLAVVLLFFVQRAFVSAKGEDPIAPPGANGTPAPAAAPAAGSAPPPATAAAPATAAGVVSVLTPTIKIASLPKLQPMQLRNPFLAPPGLDKLKGAAVTTAAVHPAPVTRPAVVPAVAHPVARPVATPVVPAAVVAPRNVARTPAVRTAQVSSVGRLLPSTGPSVPTVPAVVETPEKELERRVLLKGVLLGTFPSAFITVDGVQQLAHKGDLLPGGYRITEITEDKLVAVAAKTSSHEASTVEIRQ